MQGGELIRVYLRFFGYTGTGILVSSGRYPGERTLVAGIDALADLCPDVQPDWRRGDSPADPFLRVTPDRMYFT